MQYCLGEPAAAAPAPTAMVLRDVLVHVTTGGSGSTSPGGLTGKTLESDESYTVRALLAASHAYLHYACSWH